jgi:hypothetical protein
VTSLDGPALLRLAAGVVNGWLVLLIGAQGAGIGAALGAAPILFHRYASTPASHELDPLLPWVTGGLALLGGLGGAAFAGWRVLGGWRGARRALFVVAIGAACGGGTFASPLLLDPRGAWLVAVVSAFMAAAAGGVAVLRPAAPRPAVGPPC